MRQRLTLSGKTNIFYSFLTHPQISDGLVPNPRKCMSAGQFRAFLEELYGHVHELPRTQEKGRPLVEGFRDDIQDVPLPVRGPAPGLFQ